jgi:DNA-binding response OmpR family regulator
MDRFQILVVDDDVAIRKMITRVLESEGMRTTAATGGRDALLFLESRDYDLVILDILMPEMDGFTVLQKMRENGILTPVIMLSGKQEDTDKVLALTTGADYYITKPFNPSFLSAKIKASLRRVQISKNQCFDLDVGPFHYLCDEMRLFKNGNEIYLSGKESLLMRYLMSNQGQVLTKEQIYTNVWGDVIVDDNTVMVHIRKLRMKIEDDPDFPVYLKTIRGMGYQFLIPKDAVST